MAYHPEVQHAVAEMALALDAIGPHLDRVAQDWSDGVDHGATWPSKIVSAKHHAVEACRKVVDLAMEVSGGSGMFKTNELERLFRDARCGRFHPANSMLVHEIVARPRSGHRSRRTAALGLIRLVLPSGGQEGRCRRTNCCRASISKQISSTIRLAALLSVGMTEMRYPPPSYGGGLREARPKIDDRSRLARGRAASGRRTSGSGRGRPSGAVAAGGRDAGSLD